MHMDDSKRRTLQELIARASNKDTVALAAIEQMFLDFDRAGATDDAAAMMRFLTQSAPDEVYQDVLRRLQANEHVKGHWPYYG
jgi:hypothetical protein